MTHDLAIVIPAYKAKYLDEALRSISLQTNQHFKVYVSDDASSEDITAIVDQYKGKINISYIRFDINLGRKNLVAHWNRSVELANEDWVWLFSDDDIMSPKCVQAFYDALHITNGQHNVYRFNIEMIDAAGGIICVKDPHPEQETGFEFLKRRLQSKSLSAAVEYIFKKKAFGKNNGFVNFPLAFCSDDASWIQFAGNAPIFTIQSEKVYWRSSNINISSLKGFQHQKVEALLGYCIWIKNKFNDISLTELETWFFENLKYVYGRLNLIEKYRLSKKLSLIFKKNKFIYYKKLLSV
jgi:glycosyltransferase involved in cell wall biosynthesis